MVLSKSMRLHCFPLALKRLICHNHNFFLSEPVIQVASFLKIGLLRGEIKGAGINEMINLP